MAADVKDSILKSVKKMVGLTDEYDYFDPEIIMYINAELMHLNQLGVGTSDVFNIEDDTATWQDFLGDDTSNLPIVKPFVAGKVRLVFDPPQSSSASQALTDQLKEYEFRLQAAVEPNSEEKAAIRKEAERRIKEYYEDGYHVNIWSSEYEGN